MKGVLPVLRWYLRELTGETQFDRYLAQHRAEHPGVEPLSRREFEKRRIDRSEPRPGNSRCC